MGPVNDQIAYLDDHNGKEHLLQQQFWLRKKQRDNREGENDDSYFYFPQHKRQEELDESADSFVSARGEDIQFDLDSSGEPSKFETAEQGPLEVILNRAHSLLESVQEEQQEEEHQDHRQEAGPLTRQRGTVTDPAARNHFSLPTIPLEYKNKRKGRQDGGK
jgi:hypothetical protein